MGDWATERLFGDALPQQPTRQQPAVPARNTGRPTTPAPRRTTPAATPLAQLPPLLDKIVSIESQYPSIQKTLKAKYSLILKMLPNAVTQNVVDDWYGDLTNSATDTDPNTDSKTSMEARVIRQLQVAGYSEKQLPAALQTLLNQYRLTEDGGGVIR